MILEKKLCLCYDIDMKIKVIRQAKNLVGKRIFLRVDYNEPLNDQGELLDDYKIRSSLLTIQFLSQQKSKIILASHIDHGHSLRSVAICLSKLLNRKIVFIENCCGFETEEKIGQLKNGEIALLENLRRYKGEEENDFDFAKRLARLADIYVNDAFATSHRAHASMSAIKKYLPAYAGLFLEREIQSLNNILNPRHPLVVIMGGAKIETKLPILTNLYAKADWILLGGGMANSFMKLLGMETGQSLIDEKGIKMIQAKIKLDKDKKIFIPIDVVVRNRLSQLIRVKELKDIESQDEILDIGPQTIVLYAGIIKKAKTLVWNGPLGKFEESAFQHGTLALGKIMAAKSSGRAFGVAGGGETIEAVKLTNMRDDFDWISTGGGAMLAYLAGEIMPGLKGIVLT